ncbi:MAG: GTPase HflX, partial [Oscillospiraceae bacterium]|nr:GTPase HflX [Oscillospiraceae bacterium]
RHIRRRIAKIEEELETVMRVRGEQRRARIKREIPLVSLIGYTNAGKSTLLNALSGSDIHANDRLFDTLDTTTRKFCVSDTANVLLSDTVGFIRKLPHHLMRAFRATLEELLHADLLLNVVDASNPEAASHCAVTDEVIKSLGADDIPRLYVFNKCDLLSDTSLFSHEKDAVCVSAHTGEGFETLKSEICRLLSLTSRRTEFNIPYAKTFLMDILHRDAKVLSAEYLDDCIKVCAIANDRIFSLITKELGGQTHGQL